MKTTGERDPRPRWQQTAGLLGAVLDVGTLLLYLALVHSQEGDNGTSIALIASFIALLAGSSIGASIAAARGKPSRLLFLIPGALNIGFGVLALYSIGALLLVSGGLLLSAAPTRGDVLHQGFLGRLQQDQELD
jgi:hypothetical protein